MIAEEDEANEILQQAVRKVHYVCNKLLLLKLPFLPVDEPIEFMIIFQ